ncbi:MAG: PAS domain S-box protein [Kovacikia sp.]
MELDPMRVDKDLPPVLAAGVQSPFQMQTPEAQFALVVENMGEAFFALDLSGCCTYLNQKAEHLLGVDRHTLLGKPLWHIFQVAPSSQLYQQCYQPLIGQLPGEFEEYYSSLNRWFTVRLLPVPGGLAAYFQDITDRKESEATLRKEQEFLNVLLDTLQAGIVACDAEGKLKLFNQAARSFHGMTEQPLPPEQWASQYDLYLPDGTPMATEDIPLYRALQGQPVHDVEMRITPKQGRARLLLAYGQAIRDLEGESQGAVVVMHDITERKQIEIALRESEAQLTSIFQTIPNGIVILDQRGQITTANPAAEQILSLTRSDLTQRGYNDPSWAITTVDGHPFPEADLPFIKVMQTGEPVYGVEHAIAHPDGTRVILSINASPLFDADGKITNVIAAISDITERKRAEVSLRESEERYRSVVETVAEGIVLQHGDGSIFTCNSSAERILGLTADQIRGRSSLDPRWGAIHEDGSPFPGERHPAMVTLRTGKPQSNVTMGICKPDGTLTWISINSRPLFQPNDTKPFAVVCSFFDITDRKQTDEERVQLVQEQTARTLAEAAQRRSAFLAEVSQVLASSLEYEQTLQSVAQLAVPYFADWCSVDLLNDDGTISRVAVVHSDPEKVRLGWELARRFPRHLNDGYGVSQVMKTGQSEIVIALTDDQLVASVPNPDYLEILQGLGLRSCIVAPLQARGRVLGSVSFVFSESNRHYGIEDLDLAEDLARRAAIAIDNAHLYHTAQQAKQAAEAAAARTARLQMVTAALSESLTPEHVIEVIVEQSMAALEATAALVVLTNRDRTELEIVNSIGYQADLVESWRRFSINADVPLAIAVRTGEPIWVEALLERIRRYPHLAEVYSRYGFKSWIVLPFVVEGRSVGGMLLSFKEFKHLSQDDREFMLALTRQCAQAICRAQLYGAERQARDQAEKANRVKDEFLAVLSHELRSPLNPILGWTKILRTGQLSPDKAEQALATVERNAKLQAQLIEDLLDISRMLQGKLSLTIVPVDLTSVIDGAIETVQLAASAKSIQIQTRLQEPPNSVLGDANRLQQVLWNLLSNAIKFTPEGGRVEVRLEHVKGGQEEGWMNGNGDGHAAPEFPGQTYAQIVVTDNGKGINPDFVPHMFEYFRQADSSTTRHFGGLGLGLAIARQIVEMHGGTIRAESAGEGLGATFTVRLPFQESGGGREGQGPGTAPTNQSSPSPLMGLKILVVDDEADMRDLAEFLLSNQGADVRVAGSAAEALLILAEFGPDVLVCDIGMPDIDGYALMRLIRERSPEAGGRVPAIALTAYAGEINQQQALAAGFQLHLSKPVEPDYLISMIASLRSRIQ